MGYKGEGKELELVVVSCWIEIDTEVEWKADKINLTLAIQEQIGNGKRKSEQIYKKSEL